MEWTHINATAPGVSHLRNGLPCQDAVAVNIESEGLFIGALADGAGSRKHSQVGSRIASRTAVSYLAGQAKVLPGLNATEFRLVTSYTMATVRQELRAHSLLYGMSMADLGCTLLVVIAGHGWLGAMQLGDGFICIRPHDSAEYELLFRPEKSEYYNQTEFVTGHSSYNDIQVVVRHMDAAFLAVSSDGLQPIAIDLHRWRAGQRFFGRLERSVRNISPVHNPDAKLQQFLDSREVNRRTDDDKSLIIGLREAA